MMNRLGRPHKQHPPPNGPRSKAKVDIVHVHRKPRVKPSKRPEEWRPDGKQRAGYSGNV